MTQGEAKAVIEREPVGGARYYSILNGRFYSRGVKSWHIFIDEWLAIEKPSYHLTPMHEILAIALGDEK